MSDRIDCFRGDDKDYCKYLEAIVKDLRAHRSVCACSGYPRHPVGSKASRRFINSDATDFAGARAPTRTSRDGRIVKAAGRPKGRVTAIPEGSAWKIKADQLVRASPKADAWLRRIAELGLDEAMRTGAAARAMLESSYKLSGQPTSSSSVAQPLALIDCLEKYARVAKERASGASLELMLANFQKLLVLSSCVVLYADANTTSSKKRIYEVLKVCFGERTEPSCVDLLRTGRLINELLDSLNASGWGDRASELYLIWNHPPTWYAPMVNKPGEALLYLRNQLSSTDFTAHIEQSWVNTPLFVPSLIHQILGKKYTVAFISSKLDYKHAHVLVQVNPWLWPFVGSPSYAVPSQIEREKDPHSSTSFVRKQNLGATVQTDMAPHGQSHEEAVARGEVLQCNEDNCLGLVLIDTERAVYR